MKFFRILRALLYVVAIGAVVFAALHYNDIPINIRIGNWHATPSLAAAIAGLALLYCMTALALKILHTTLSAPLIFNRWLGRQATVSRHQLLVDGVRAWVRGDYARALKMFQRLSKDTAQDEVYAWLAAEAAKQAGNRKQHNQLLHGIANRDNAADRSIVAAAKAQIARDDSRLHDALEILSAAGAPDSSPLLAKMYLHIARECEKWERALAAAYRLREWSPTFKYQKAVADIIQRGLHSVTDKEQLQAFWKNHVRADEQKQPPLLADYIHALHRCGDEATITKTLERAAKNASESPEILSAIATLGSRDMCKTAFAAVRSPEEAAFLPAMAQLAMRLELWGQARRYYQMAAALRPDPAYTAALAKIEEKIHVGEDTSNSVAA